MAFLAVTTVETSNLTTCIPEIPGPHSSPTRGILGEIACSFSETTRNTIPTL
jgi:hypothetical protein